MNHHTRILGADYCPYCVKVKKYFESKGLQYEWVDTQAGEGAEERKKLSAKHNWKTIPMVFVNGNFVGGCDDFFKALTNKKISL